MRRNMSYRKPAPLYVPSPPTSPAVNPICPPFLIAKGGTDKLYGGQSTHTIVKQKPLPILPSPNQVQEASTAKTPPFPSSRSNAEPLPVTRQSSKARTTSSGALSTLNYCSDSENTTTSCVSAPNSKSMQRSLSQRSRHTSTLTQPYRPPTPPRQTEHRRYSRGYTSTTLYKDDHERTRASTYGNQYDGNHSHEPYGERHQFHGPRGWRAVRAVSMGTSPSYMTERTQFSLGASERSMAWSGGVTVVATAEGYPSYPVLPTLLHKEIVDREMSEPDPDGFVLIQSSFWDKMGMWVVSLKIRSKIALRGCCL